MSGINGTMTLQQKDVILADISSTKHRYMSLSKGKQRTSSLCMRFGKGDPIGLGF